MVKDMTYCTDNWYVHKVLVHKQNCSNEIVKEEMTTAPVPRSLTHSHTMTPFDTPGKRAF